MKNIFEFILNWWKKEPLDLRSARKALGYGDDDGGLCYGNACKYISAIKEGKHNAHIAFNNRFKLIQKYNDPKKFKAAVEKAENKRKIYFSKERNRESMLATDFLNQDEKTLETMRNYFDEVSIYQGIDRLNNKNLLNYNYLQRYRKMRFYSNNEDVELKRKRPINPYEI